MTAEVGASPASQTILVVDDDPRIRFLVQRILERSGYVVHLAADVTEADRIVREAPPQLVVLDVTLPNGSGGDLLRVWRARGVQLPW